MSTASTEEHLLKLREHQELLKEQIRAAEARVVEYNEEATRAASSSPGQQSVRYYQRNGHDSEREDFDPSPRRERYEKSPRHPDDFTGRVLCVANIDDPLSEREIPAPLSSKSPHRSECSPSRINVNNFDISKFEHSSPSTRQTRAGLWTSPAESSPQRSYAKAYRSYGNTERPVPPPMR